MICKMKERIVLITGVSRGIGLATALRFSAAGATVIGTTTNKEGKDVFLNQLCKLECYGESHIIDVNDTIAIQTLVREIVDKYGKLDVLINNAAIHRDNLALRMKEEDWDVVLNTNLKSVFCLSRLVLRSMMKIRWGRIVNITSVVGSIGNAGQVNYAAAKAGVEGMSRSLAHEVGSRGITVNCVAPGFIETNMTNKLSQAQKISIKSRIPLGRFGIAADIAAAVFFLSSDNASYITGTTLHVNGGMYM